MELPEQLRSQMGHWRVGASRFGIARGGRQAFQARKLGAEVSLPWTGGWVGETGAAMYRSSLPGVKPVSSIEQLEFAWKTIPNGP
jgi:hypothetical protein